MSLFKSPNPHFFKIILHQNLAQGKLDLPNKFVKNNGGSLLFNEASLYLPDGGKWTVQLKNLDGKICFLRGWPDFLRFYSIQLGYFLVFQLKGICCFDVLIFDTSATEIDYPTRRPPVRVPKSENEEEEESVQILNETVFKRRRGKEKETTAYCSVREMKIPKPRVFTTPQGFSDEDEDLKPNYSRRQTNYRGSASYKGDDGRSSPETMRPMHSRITPPVLTENQLVVVRRAKSFKCTTNHPSFMVTMRPSYIQTGNYLSLPRIFSERYIKESVDVKLEVDDGMSWRVWCGVRWAFTRRRTEFKGGWKRFAVDNDLDEGDICVFELMNKTPKFHFHVTIFRLPSPQ